MSNRREVTQPKRSGSLVELPPGNSVDDMYQPSLFQVLNTVSTELNDESQLVSAMKAFDLKPLYEADNSNQIIRMNAIKDPSKLSELITKERPDPHDDNLTYQFKAAMVTIVENGVETECFSHAGVSEGNVMDVIRSIAERKGFRYYEGMEGVVTSISEIQGYLQDRGLFETHDGDGNRVKFTKRRIKEKLSVLRRALISQLKRYGDRQTKFETDFSYIKELYVYSPDNDTLDENYNENTDQIFIQLNAYIMSDIKKSFVRNLDQVVLHKIRSNLMATMVYKYMCLFFTNADMAGRSVFKLDVSTIRKMAQLTPYSKDYRDAYKPVKKALDLLVEVGQISHYEVPKRGKIKDPSSPRGRQIDQRIDIFATREFAEHMKRSNSRYRIKDQVVKDVVGTFEEQQIEFDPTMPISPETQEVAAQKYREKRDEVMETGYLKKKEATSAAVRNIRENVARHNNKKRG